MTASTPGNSTSELLQSLSADLSALVRQEFQRAAGELTGKIRQTGKGAALLGGAGLLGVMTVGTSTTLLVRLLERRFSPATSAFLATALLGGAAGALAAAGLAEVRKALPLVPEETVAGLRSDVRVATGEDTPGSA